MPPENLFSTEKLMQLHQQELEREARELWKWRPLRKPLKRVYALLLTWFV